MDELWLDHDLGGEDTIWPVVEVLERAAFDERPFDIGVVFIHSANPPGAAKIGQALGRWGHHVSSVPGSTHVGYLSHWATSAGRQVTGVVTGLSCPDGSCAARSTA